MRKKGTENQQQQNISAWNKSISICLRKHSPAGRVKWMHTEASNRARQFEYRIVEHFEHFQLLPPRDKINYLNNPK